MMMTGYTRVAKRTDIPPGGCVRVFAGGRAVGLFNLGGEIFAIDDRCTHAEASLCDGDVSGDEVVCPLHFATFNIRTGECTGPPATEDVRTYAVRMVGDDVEVSMEKRAGESP